VISYNISAVLIGNVIDLDALLMTSNSGTHFVKTFLSGLVRDIGIMQGGPVATSNAVGILGFCGRYWKDRGRKEEE